jgi:hypothetical protein
VLGAAPWYMPRVCRRRKAERQRHGVAQQQVAEAAAQHGSDCLLRVGASAAGASVVRSPAIIIYT